MYAATGINADGRTLTGSPWTSKTLAWGSGFVNVVMCVDTVPAGWLVPRGVYLAAGDGGKLRLLNPGTGRSYNSTASWTTVASSFGTTPIYAGVANAGMYVYLVGGAGKIGRSLQNSTLSTWTQTATPFGLSPIVSVTGTGNLFVAGSADGKLARKNDHPLAETSAWTLMTLPSSAGVLGLAVGRPSTVGSNVFARYVAGLSTGEIMYWDARDPSQADSAVYANSWTLLGTNVFGGMKCTSVTWSQYWGLYVAVGDSGKIFTSATGTAWTAASTPAVGTSNITQVTGGGQYGDTFALVTDDGKIATSPDGDTWTLQASNLSGTPALRCVNANISTAIAGGPSSAVSITIN